MTIDAQQRASAALGFRHVASLLAEKAETAPHKRALLTQHALSMTQIADTLAHGDTPPPAVVRLWQMMLCSALALLDVRGEL